MLHRIGVALVGSYDPVRTHRALALTIGAIARELGEPIHRVQYAIRTRGIEPECLAGNIRVFGDDTIERVAGILNEIDGQRLPIHGGMSQ
jgi:hypothetical protein